VKKDDVVAAIKKNVKKAVKDSYGGSTTADKSFTKAIDKVQKQLKCCGVDKADDWVGSTWHKSLKSNATAVPSSCCKTSGAGCNSAANYKTQAWESVLLLFSSSE